MPTFSARLRDRVEIWRSTSTPNDPDPSDFTKDDGPALAAEIVDMEGGELVSSRTTDSSARAMITVRYCRQVSTLNATDKLIARTDPYMDVQFNIVAKSITRQQGRPHLMEIVCTRGS